MKDFIFAPNRVARCLTVNHSLQGQYGFFSIKSGANSLEKWCKSIFLHHFLHHHF